MSYRSAKKYEIPIYKCECGYKGQAKEEEPPKGRGTKPFHVCPECDRYLEKENIVHFDKKDPS